MSAPTRKGFSGLIRRGPMAADVIGRDFTMVFNAAVRDRRLSRRARGLLVEILSHRDGFGISEAALIAGGPEGRDAIRKALRELEAYGYLHRRQDHGEDGRFTETVFEVTDMPEGLRIGASAPWERPAEPPEEPSTENRRSEPSPENPSTVSEEQNRRSGPLTEKPSTVLPSTVNPQHKKTNSSCSAGGTEDSLSPARHTPEDSGGAGAGEREAAAPDHEPADGVPVQRAGTKTANGADSVDGQAVADEFAAQWRRAHGTRPGRRQLVEIASAAAEAIEDGDAPDWLLGAVVPFMVARRYLDLGRAKIHRDCPPQARPQGQAPFPGSGQGAGGRERCPDHPRRYRRGCVDCALAVPA